MASTENGASAPAPQASTTPSLSNGPTEQRQTKICVYCGASPGNKPEHMESARQLARVMAAHNIGLVYGGGTVGLMGEIARTLVSLTGPDSVHGIIPEPLVKFERDPTYTSFATNGSSTGAKLAIPEETVFGRTTIVPDMHTRKRLMAQEVAAGGPGSGFIALPGGYGTLEELLEAATWNQLGIQSLGICLLNVNGFYDGLLGWVEKSVEEGFIRPGNASIMVSANTPEDAIQALREYKVSESQFKLQWGNE
ncbi:lysine decarboxylase family protein [Diaporthe amygdali]|uniref:lysine decarboxylase family protein n=1 Tax=Phomopsis amygdali TaxID=1214568 RepID=UPI0022FE5A2A|nr:lysine decarboxylase family protein [Diaporthe amygdali]KAJ0117059.1 lysine decarboxylase family protein [Diaporthe amygdali]